MRREAIEREERWMFIHFLFYFCRRSLEHGINAENADGIVFTILLYAPLAPSIIDVNAPVAASIALDANDPTPMPGFSLPDDPFNENI